MATNIDAAEAKRRIHQPGEIALIDVREAGEFGEGHLLFAVPCPYSRLEIDFPRLVPRLAVPIILVDGDDGVAERAARRLDALGCSDISILAGGLAAWANAGHAIYKGVNVPSKLLGELAEHELEPQRISPETLAEWQASNTPFLFFDTRPPAEHAKMRVPGSVCLPNGELAHRFSAAVPDRQATVVVTCAGRTRGLIGASGLKISGITNPVFALENGTQGWQLSGFALDRGGTPAPYPELDASARDDSVRRGAALCAADGIAMVDAPAVAKLIADPSRTVHVIDVRSEAEAKSDRIPSATHALGGQLVQGVDQWIGTRRSRVVLIDDTGLRAGLAAYWLKRLGYDVVVHRISAATYDLPAPPRPAVARTPLGTIAAAEAAAQAAHGEGAIVDLRHSSAYRKAHPAEARWSIRPRLDRLSHLAGKTVCLLADDDCVSELASLDLVEAGAKSVMLIVDGLAGWQRAGFPIVENDPNPKPEDAIDFLLFVHDRHDGNLDACRLYLAWEQGLMAQVDADERAEFAI